MLNLGRNNVSSVGSLLENTLVAVLRETSDVDVNNLTSLGIVGRPLVLTKSIAFVEVRRQETLLLLSGDLYRGWHVLRLLHLVVVDTSIDRATTIRVTIESGTLLRLFHFNASLRNALGSLFLHVSSVQPVALRRHKALVGSLLRRAHRRSIDLMTYVVDVSLSLVERLILRVVGLLEHVGLKFALLQHVRVLLHRVVGLGETVLSVPAGVRRHIDSLIGLVIVQGSLIMQSGIGMSQHVRAELLGLSLFTVDLVVTCYISGSLILVSVGLMRVSPVSSRRHEGAISLLSSMHGLITIELFHFAILSSLVGDDASGRITLQSTGEVLLLLPSLGTFLITIETSTASIATLQVLPVETVGSRSSEDLALPILVLASRNWMMKHAVTLLIGSLIVAQHIGAGERSRLALTNTRAGTRQS